MLAGMTGLTGTANALAPVLGVTPAMLPALAGLVLGVPALAGVLVAWNRALARARVATFGP